jgi:apolipoprotein N-acyltransferase
MMKRTRNTEYSPRLDIQNIRPYWFLIAGIITMTFSHLTLNIDIVGWFSMVPFLVYLNITRGWKSKLLFALALVVAWSIIVFKIITPPIPYMLIFLYSIPISLIHLPGYLIWAKFRERRFSILIFPAMMVVLEWIQYTFTPLASWGVAAYTQTSSIDILQFLSIFGMAGLSFLIYWVNLSIATIIVKKERSFLSFTLPVSILCFVIVFGTLRFEINKSKGVENIKVAAIGTDSEIGGLPLPDCNKNENDIENIFRRTEKAAESGAKIVSWTEGSFYLEPSNEASWVQSFCTLADESNVTLVASYILLLSESPFRYENKYLMIDSTGKILYSYLKHQPVPGEPALKGTDPLQVVEVEGIKLGAVICYDYDFPYLAKEYGDINADIVAVPSSDWRGIDPLHTRMAAYRAIEQGHSLLRSTRFGLSAAINPYGEMSSQMSSFDKNNKIMIAQLPVKGIKTVYSTIGDILVYLCIAFILFFFILKRSS